MSGAEKQAKLGARLALRGGSARLEAWQHLQRGPPCALRPDLGVRQSKSLRVQTGGRGEEGGTERSQDIQRSLQINPALKGESLSRFPEKEPTHSMVRFAASGGLRTLDPLNSEKIARHARRDWCSGCPTAAQAELERAEDKRLHAVADEAGAAWKAVDAFERVVAELKAAEPFNPDLPELEEQLEQFRQQYPKLGDD